MTDLTLRGVHHVTLTVSDLEVSEAWYVSVLGLTRLARRDAEGFERVILTSDPGVRIGLTEHVATEGWDTFSPLRIGLDHLSFGCSDREELHAWERRLRDAGVTADGIVDEGDRLILPFRDPDGIALEFFVFISS